MPVRAIDNTPHLAIESAWSLTIPFYGEVHVRPVTPADSPFLLQVYASTREQELSDLPWSSAQKEAFLHMQFELRRKHYLTHYPKACHGVIAQCTASNQPEPSCGHASRLDGETHAKLAEQALGCLMWQWQNNDLRLIDIALLSTICGRNIGTAVLRSLQAQAQAKACTMTLQVEPSNPAQRLYQRLGFQALACNSQRRLMRWSSS